MNLSEALHKIAVTYDLNETELAAYAQEDTIGGYHENPAYCKWPMGSVWEVEAQIVYALARALKPQMVIEIGSYYGCSTHHIAEALWQNGAGKLISIDISFMYKVPERYAHIIEQLNTDLFDYHMSPNTVDFVFEDSMHTVKSTTHIWNEFKANGKPGAIIVSHDSEHETEGIAVRGAIATITPNYISMLVQPGKCGLGIWRKPS